MTISSTSTPISSKPAGSSMINETRQIDENHTRLPNTGTTDARESTLRSVLQDTALVNEEELFCSLVQLQLEEIDQTLSSKFTDLYSQQCSLMQRSDGYIPIEQATTRALDALSLDLTAAGSQVAINLDQIAAKAFASAQLDANHSLLFDSRGSSTDPTIATQNTDVAIRSAIASLGAIEEGHISALTSFSATSFDTIRQTDGPNGFLWKPTSDSDGKLVVLLPNDLTGHISSVQIHNALPPSDSTLLESGRFSGDQHNGNRGHYRFSNSGHAYGRNIYVVAVRTDGTSVSWNIRDGGKRQD